MTEQRSNAKITVLSSVIVKHTTPQSFSSSEGGASALSKRRASDGDVSELKLSREKQKETSRQRRKDKKRKKRNRKNERSEKRLPGSINSGSQLHLRSARKGIPVQIVLPQNDKGKDKVDESEPSERTSSDSPSELQSVDFASLYPDVAGRFNQAGSLDSSRKTKGSFSKWPSIFVPSTPRKCATPTSEPQPRHPPTTSSPRIVLSSLRKADDKQKPRSTSPTEEKKSTKQSNSKLGRLIQKRLENKERKVSKLITKNNFTRGEIEELMQTVSDPITGVRLRRTPVYRRNLDKVWYGRDMVSFLVEHSYCDNRKDAAETASYLLRTGFFVPVSDPESQTVYDKKMFYRFVRDDKKNQKGGLKKSGINKSQLTFALFEDENPDEEWDNRIWKDIEVKKIMMLISPEIKDNYPETYTTELEGGSSSLAGSTVFFDYFILFVSFVRRLLISGKFAPICIMPFIASVFAGSHHNRMLKTKVLTWSQNIEFSRFVTYHYVYHESVYFQQKDQELCLKIYNTLHRMIKEENDRTKAGKEEVKGKEKELATDKQESTTAGDSTSPNLFKSPSPRLSSSSTLSTTQSSLPLQTKLSPKPSPRGSDNEEQGTSSSSSSVNTNTNSKLTDNVLDWVEGLPMSLSHDVNDDRSWNDMSAQEIITESIRAACSWAQESSLGAKINQLEGVLLMDTIDMQTKSVLVDRLNSIEEFKSGEVISECAIQHPLVRDYDARKPTRLVCEKVFTSLARPVLLSFKQIKNGTIMSGDSVWEEVKPRIIYKVGDNLEQDSAVILSFRVFNMIWTSAATDSVIFDNNVKKTPWIETYEIFPTGFNKEGLRAGFMEAIEGAESFKEFDWSTWAFRSNSDMHQRMITSAAGAYIGGYVLGVRDRHWDNILIKNKQALLHIDFGFVLGTQPPIDAPKFSISSEMKWGLLCIDKWQEFVDISVEAYRVLRQRSDEVISACKMIFGFSLDWELEPIEQYLRESLKLDQSEEEALAVIRSEIEGSSVAWQNFFKQWGHRTIDPLWYGLLKKHFPPAVAIMSQVEASTKEKVDAKKSKRTDSEMSQWETVSYMKKRRNTMVLSPRPAGGGSSSSALEESVELQKVVVKQ